MHTPQHKLSEPGTTSLWILCFAFFNFRHFSQRHREAKVIKLCWSAHCDVWECVRLSASASIFMQRNKNGLYAWNSPHYCPTLIAPTHTDTHSHAVSAFAKAIKRRGARSGEIALVIECWHNINDHLFFDGGGLWSSTVHTEPANKKRKQMCNNGKFLFCPASTHCCCCSIVLHRIVLHN